MYRKHFMGALCATIASLSLGWVTPVLAQTPTTLAGVKFEPEITLGGQKLQLNGAGVRYKFVKVYAAGLYTSAKATKNEDVLKPTAKRFQMVSLRDVKGDEFGKLFTRAMEDNATKEEFAKSINSVIRMGQIFADAKQFAKGDVITVDFVPGTGTMVTHNGKQRGEPFKEPEFHSLMMKIWFGPKPADDALRKALLGEQTSANTNVN